jgi:hypothetical protein
MTAARRTKNRAPRPLPRWSFGVLDIVHAAVIGAAAAFLPWKTFTVFGVFAAVVALMHALRAALTLAAHPFARPVFRYGAMLSLAFLAYMTWGLGSSAVYVARLYGTLGQGIAAAAATIWAVAVLLTVPLSIWALAATGGAPKLGRAKVVAPAAVLLLLATGFAVRDRQAALDDRPVPSPDEIDAAVERALAGWQPLPKGRSASLFSEAPIVCEGDAREGQRLFLTWVTKMGTPASACVAVGGAADIEAEIARVLAEGAGGPIKIDVLEGTQDLPGLGPLLGMIALRPGLDGVCAGPRCLMPWQLVALDQFSQMGEVSSIQLRFGITPLALRGALGVDGDGTSFTGLTRISTRSLLVDGEGKLRRLVRLRDGGPELSPEALATSVGDARRFILDVQETDGRFGYLVDPFRGTVSYDNFSVPRQAGTTLALCELSDGAEDAVRVAAERSLRMLATLEQRAGDHGALIFPRGATRLARLGDTALPLIAFLACREHVGDKHDDLIARLGGLLLAMQREDGSFHPNFDVKNDVVLPGNDPLYAEGQVVMALVLWEGATDPPLRSPPPEGLRAAIDRAMDHFSGPYWDYVIGDFFYLEENWHCLAARAALPHHRHDAYERFCIDYVSMKKRLTFDEDSDVAPELVGAYGFGNVLPPHNTATAGFGEALAAKMDLMKAREMDITAEEADMKRTLQFLVAQQWQSYSCFACTTRRNIVGGFSESVGSPQIRIDYVQHALAALGHGGRMLGYL